ncbi:hypothetical protein C7C46_12590 [Streptomyces tateyamensis]|uniref:Allene oxide cyclase n=1 Tax=Streptomyces tateyamensis TaxID=565073 RepID=A0A2V4NUV5_9ACTN|nr:hypothetical protein [Streptomyces tateyamensis]PYC80524.1 hypothetical protein C7C46_12590 [Streptomyces tateyamensis]
MQRVVTVKRSVALAVAGLVVGTVGALSIPSALATNHTAHKAAAVPALTLDFSGTNDEANVPQTVGAAFGGTARVKDTNGAVVGTAYDLCDKDAVSAAADQAFCTGLIKFNSGDQISFSAELPISNTGASGGDSFNGVVNGGTGIYEGITGQANFVPRAQGVYDLNFS